MITSSHPGKFSHGHVAGNALVSISLWQVMGVFCGIFYPFLVAW
jgi:hypothetical protein